MNDFLDYCFNVDIVVDMKTTTQTSKATETKSFAFTNKRTGSNLGTYVASNHLAAGSMMARAQGYGTFEDWMGATGDVMNLFMVTD